MSSRTLLLTVCLLAMCGPLGACRGEGALSPAGPVSDAERVILLDALTIMLAIVVPTLVAALGFAWWFRAGNPRAGYFPDWAYSGRIELIVWSIPTLVILFLGGVIWIGSHALDPFRPLSSARSPLEIQVVSLDWKWLFIYPGERLATVNELIVPLGTPVHFSLTSASVMDVFFVPRLGTMIYTMNGMVTQLNLEADQPGDYLGESAQFSGDGFSDMRFTLRVVSDESFASWLREARRQTTRLDRGRYTALARPGVNRSAMTFGDVDPDLFQDVVAQRIPPGPGPDNPEPTRGHRPGTAALKGMGAWH